MIRHATSKELVEEYERGGVSLLETLDLICDQAASGDIEAELRSLPPWWRKDVELYIFDTYDNDVSPEDFLWIGPAEPEPEKLRRSTLALRAWIAKKKVSSAYARGGLHA